MNSTLSQLHAWVVGSRLENDAAFSGVSTDSRRVETGNLFIALRGERFDAHEFLDEVVAQGASAIMVERIPEELSIPALVVPDTRVALGEIARHWRQQFSLPLIGVTGSNGKTTVKEMIASVLTVAFGSDGFLATQGNMNNEIGVPLTLLRLEGTHRAAVIELGMNHEGEIAQLAEIAQPTVGLVNNAQREHQEFMQSVERVAQENGAVITALPDDGAAVFPADDKFSSLWRKLVESHAQCQVETFGLGADADVTCHHQLNDFASDLMVYMNGESFPVRLLAAGLHNVRNALAAAACCRAIGIDASLIAKGLESFAPANGRMQRKTAKNGAVVIDDTYNANPDSVLAAIDVLAQTSVPRILVLGDMGEVGSNGRAFHEEVGAHAQALGVDYLLTLGDLARHSADVFGANGVHFEGVDALMLALNLLLRPDATVLVKGSRFMQMERVVRQLVDEATRENH